MPKEGVVLIHGWGMHSECWRPILPALNKNYAVKCIDLPGHGSNVEKKFPSTLPELARWVLNQCSSKEPLVFMGWSLGGWVALMIGMLFPERVSRLAVVGVPALGGDRFGPDSVKNAFGVFQLLLNTSPKKAMQRLLALIIKGESEPRQTLKKIQLLLAKRPIADQKALLRGLDILNGASLGESMKQLHCPILFLFGENDYFMAAKDLLEVEKKQSNVTCTIVPKTGHAPFVSSPVLFIQAFNHYMRNDNEQCLLVG